MRNRTRKARAVAGISLIVGALSTGAPPAHASFHFMMIREVFAGSAAHPTAHFVELQMYVSGQNFVSGKQVKVFSASGSEAGSLTFPGSVPNGASQATILVGTPEVQTAFGIVPDLAMTPVIAASGGKACFVDPGDYINPGGNIDCVSWGSFAPGGDTGTPAPAIPSGMSIERKISGGNPAILDSEDDTNNSAADFQVAAPSPRNNSGAAPAPPPGSDTSPPASDIGKPAPGKTYNDTTFRKFRGTAADGGGLALVEIALRQKLASGCRWWNGNRFVSGGCNKKRFRPASGLASWTYALSKKLKPSDEGNVRFYTLYARATDAAGNMETAFQKGRNANRFEIT